VPLLSDSLERVKEVVSKILPTEKKLTPLEEAEFEEVSGEDGALRREMTMQGMVRCMQARREFI
jgi:ATPase family AAA domain-containing protein 2